MIEPIYYLGMFWTVLGTAFITGFAVYSMVVVIVGFSKNADHTFKLWSDSWDGHKRFPVNEAGRVARQTAQSLNLTAN